MSKFTHNGEIPSWLKKAGLVCFPLYVIISLASDLGLSEKKDKRDIASGYQAGNQATNQSYINEKVLSPEQSNYQLPESEEFDISKQQVESQNLEEQIKSSVTDELSENLTLSKTEKVDATVSLVNEKISSDEIKSDLVSGLDGALKLAQSTAGKENVIKAVKSTVKDTQVRITTKDIYEKSVVSSVDFDSEFVVEDGTEWLLEQPRENYSLQLGSFRNEASLQQFARSKPELIRSDLRQLKSAKGWYYLLYGSHEIRQLAEQVKNSYKEPSSILIRRIGVLRDIRCENSQEMNGGPACS